MRQRSTDDADEDREMDAAVEEHGQGAERRLEEAWRKRKEFGTDRDALVRTQVVSAQPQRSSGRRQRRRRRRRRRGKESKSSGFDRNRWKLTLSLWMDGWMGWMRCVGETGVICSPPGWSRAPGPPPVCALAPCPARVCAKRERSPTLARAEIRLR